MIVLRESFGGDAPASPLRRKAHAALNELLGSAVDDCWVDDVLITISELVQNVGQHTEGGGELTLSVTADGVLIEVADSATTPPRLQHPDPRHAGGRGLLLINAMSLAWGTRHHEGGKTVWTLMPAPALTSLAPM